MRRYLPFIVILLLATGLRFYRIDAQSFWNDEGNSARLSERSIKLIIEGTASDVHPPLYYLILRGWRELVGDSEFGLRSFSAFSGVVLVALVASLIHWGKSANLDRRALFAMLITATSPALIYYSQETRMYMLFPLLAILGTVLFERRPTFFGRVAYLLVMAAGLYTHYFFPIIFVVHGVLALLRWRLTGEFFRWLATALLSLLLYAPWIPYMLNGLGGNRGVGQSTSSFLTGAAEFLLTGGDWQRFPDTIAYFLLTSVVILILLSRSLKSWIWLTVLPAALIVLGATDAEFYKFLLVLVPLSAVGIVKQVSASSKAIASYAVVGAMVFLNLTSLDQLYHEPVFARDDYRGMAQQIEMENHPNAAILLNAPNQWEVFTYYHRDGAPVYPIPRTRDYGETLAELEKIASGNDRLYVLYWGDQQQDPNRWVETWLDANTFKAREAWRGDVRFVTYAVPAATRDEAQTPIDALFGDKIRLNGYTLNADQLQPNDVIQLTLFWEAVAPVNDRYKLFVHLLGDESVMPIAQKDSEPMPLTAEWVAGTTFVSNVGVLVPADARGKHTLAIGWYDALDPTRRLKIDSSADTLPITTIEIVP